MHPISCDCCSPATSSVTANWFCRMRHPLQPQSAHEQHPHVDDSRNAHLTRGTCPVCGCTFPIEGRGIYCGPTCRQRAFRLRRHQANRPTATHLTDRLRQERRLIAQTVYECPSCTERFLGQRR